MDRWVIILWSNYVVGESFRWKASELYGAMRWPFSILWFTSLHQWFGFIPRTQAMCIIFYPNPLLGLLVRWSKLLGEVFPVADFEPNRTKPDRIELERSKADLGRQTPNRIGDNVGAVLAFRDCRWRSYVVGHLVYKRERGGGSIGTCAATLEPRNPRRHSSFPCSPFSLSK